MKFLPILIASTGSLHAALIARIETDKGPVQVELQYTKAPQAVANFITLSQGTRKRLDVTNGVITNKRFYVGEKFFRVINDPEFKIAQTGSGNGTNTGGGPGYTFKDEFDPTLTFDPYVLAMANSGPNSNTSQIFLTGNATAHHLDNVHSIFGLIPDPASRAVIDAIMAAGNDGATITGVTISRTDPAAEAFNEFAQQLPDLICPKGHLSVVSGVSTTWNFDVPLTSGDTFQGFTSGNLAAGSWTQLDGPAHIGVDSEPASIPSAQLDTASASKAFYNLVVVKNPTAVTPSSLAGRTVTFNPTSPPATIIYAFDATGAAGTCTLIQASGTTTGTFHTFDSNGNDGPPVMGVHNVSSGFNATNALPFFLNIGCDSTTPTTIVCHNSSYVNSSDTWYPTTGTVTISR